MLIFYLNTDPGIADYRRNQIKNLNSLRIDTSNVTKQFQDDCSMPQKNEYANSCNI